MNVCKKCKKVLKNICYPDNYDNYELIVNSEQIKVYQCKECGSYIKNEHKRYGYQTEYLPANTLIDEKQCEELKALNFL